VQLRHILLLFALYVTIPASAQESPAAENNAPSPPAENSNTSPPQDKRVFGVFPNNRTTEASYPFQPISAKRKMTIAAKDSFDWPVYLTSGLFASLYQLEDQNHSFGQGMAGYGKRYATAYGDQLLGNLMTEGIVPSLLHQDPRYFRMGVGSTKSRLGKALMQIVVTRTDSGGHMFNFSEWGGNAAAAAIANAYYPDTRTASDNIQKLLVACATDAFSNLMKEFWPDVKTRLLRKRTDKESTTR
jgi:hypothetical protein